MAKPPATKRGAVHLLPLTRSVHHSIHGIYKEKSLSRGESKYPFFSSTLSLLGGYQGPQDLISSGADQQNGDTTREVGVSTHDHQIFALGPW